LDAGLRNQKCIKKIPLYGGEKEKEGNTSKDPKAWGRGRFILAGGRSEDRECASYARTSFRKNPDAKIGRINVEKEYGPLPDPVGSRKVALGHGVEDPTGGKKKKVLDVARWGLEQSLGVGFPAFKIKKLRYLEKIHSSEKKAVKKVASKIVGLHGVQN